MRAETACAPLLAALLAVASPACLASSVLDTNARLAPKEAASQVPWRAAQASEIPGFFAAESIEGEAAASVLAIYYYFLEDGSYTGAALVLMDSQRPSFQTLTGNWTFDAQGLVLDDQAPLPLLAADQRLKLETPLGAVVLRKVVLP